MGQIIDVSNVSYESIRDALLEYINNLPQDQKFDTDYESGIGRTFVDIVAGIAAFLAYKIVLSRNEMYLPSANLKTSVVSIAEGLGYNVTRDTPATLTIKCSPSENKSLKRFDYIGAYGDYGIYSAGDYDLFGGTDTEIQAYVGNLVEDTLISIGKISVYRFTSQVSTVVDLYIDNEKKELGSSVEDLLNGKFLLLTNPFQSVDVYYYGSVEAGKEIKIKGIQAVDVEVESSNISFAYDFMSYQSHVDYQEGETIDSIKVNVPLAVDTLKVVRAREDYPKLFILWNPSRIIDSASHDISPAYVEVSYLTSDKTVLSSEEKDDFLDYIDQFRPMGVPLPTIKDPEEVLVTIKVSVTLLGTSYDSASINESILDLFKEYENKLDNEMDLSKLEYDIERIDGVKVARVETLENDVKYTNDGSSQTVDITTGDIVLNADGDNSNGLNNHYYKALVDQTSIDLSTEDFSDTEKWEDMGVNSLTLDWYQYYNIKKLITYSY